MSKVRQINLKNEKGFTLVELMVALVIISILASVAISNFSSTKVRAYDATAQANLRSFFQACKDYWTFNSSSNACTTATVSNTEYGYTPSGDIEISIDGDGNNTEYDFVATARHSSSTHAFAIDHRGVVSQISIEAEEDDGNNGGGCSDEAKKDPKNLKKKAKGGCKGE